MEVHTVKESPLYLQTLLIWCIDGIIQLNAVYNGSQSLMLLSLVQDGVDTSHKAIHLLNLSQTKEKEQLETSTLICSSSSSSSGTGKHQGKDMHRESPYPSPSSRGAAVSQSSMHDVPRVWGQTAPPQPLSSSVLLSAAACTSSASALASQSGPSASDGCTASVPRPTVTEQMAVSTQWDQPAENLKPRPKSKSVTEKFASPWWMNETAHSLSPSPWCSPDSASVPGSTWCRAGRSPQTAEKQQTLCSAPSASVSIAIFATTPHSPVAVPGLDGNPQLHRGLVVITVSASCSSIL